MRSWLLGGACALALMGLSAATARGQCAGGGGGGGTAMSAGGATTGTTAASATGGRLLTGPGSWAYSMMLQTRMRQAIAQQQYAIAAQEAAERAELKAKRQANWQQRRSSELIQRQQRRELALATANR
jgi:hypothetical protein